MAGKKYSDIYARSNTTSVVANDIFILERSDGNTYAFTANTLYNNITLSGPFANDSVASATISVGHLYYDSNGFVKIRLV